MTISIDELGIWGDLGTITPQLSNFVAFPISSVSKSEIFRLTAIGNVPQYAKVWLRQQIGGIELNRWVSFYPKSNISQIVNLGLPKTLEANGVNRIFEAKKSFKYLSDDSFIDFQLKLEDFTSFSLNIGLSDQEKEYLAQLLRDYITEIGQNPLQQGLPPALL